MPATEADSERIRMAKADALFDEARKLVDAGKRDEACAKFDQSLKLNPNAIGSILNVARCREDAGRVASATRMFTEARDRAVEQHLDEYKRAADEHLASLASRVPYLHVEFTEDPTPETRLLIDNTIAPITSADIPVDPGTRTLTVSQPGRVSYERKVTVVEHQRVSVRIPKLGRPIIVSHTRRTLGKIFTATGGATALGALGFVWYAHNLWQDQFKTGHCENESAARPMCDDDGYTATHTARTYGNVGTGLGLASATLIGVGVYLWVTAPQNNASIALLPAVAPDLVGIAAVGRF